MKRILIIMVAVIFATLFIPLIIVSLLSGTNAPEEKISVYIKSDDRVEEIEINDYIAGVVAAEMPSDFEEEALKAQAVAARTYLRAHIDDAKQGNISEEHKDAVLCTDSTHCQAWTNDVPKKVIRAVKATKNQIMTYNGEPISAVFHSTSSGFTESAVDVWGTEIPYLQSVESEGDLYSPKYLSEVTVCSDEFKSTVSANVQDVNWDGALFADISRSEAGGIKNITVGNQIISGTEFRKIFDLNSTNVELTEQDGNIIMSVKGYGHGVGMSQYGANYLASQGENYEKILETYYTDIEISNW
jgi:stage II sporulation protein D